MLAVIFFLATRISLAVQHHGLVFVSNSIAKNSGIPMGWLLFFVTSFDWFLTRHWIGVEWFKLEGYYIIACLLNVAVLQGSCVLSLWDSTDGNIWFHNVICFMTCLLCFCLNGLITFGSVGPFRKLGGSTGLDVEPKRTGSRNCVSWVWKVKYLCNMCTLKHQNIYIIWHFLLSLTIYCVFTCSDTCAYLTQCLYPSDLQR